MPRPNKDLQFVDINGNASGVNALPPSEPLEQPNGNPQNNSGTADEPLKQPTQEAATGSGIESAIGTQYSWNKQGTDVAKNTYEQEVLKAKQDMLNNRQTIENNAVNYQNQTDMMKYQNNQNAEKVGWTGGYVLDQNRQMEYLKASIQAQMYGAMELQKYGYDSALAAARLSYDLNQQEYARQYYQEAVTAALSEAQVTGTYFSAEAKDMLAQLHVAEEKLKENPDDEQASNVQRQIETWFESNKISKAGVKTLEAWQAEQSLALQWSQENYVRYNAALQTANTKVNEDVNTFIAYNNEGEIDYNDAQNGIGSEVRTIDLSTLTMDNMASYILNGMSGEEQGNERAINKRTEQAQNYINYLYEKAKADATTTKTNGESTTKSFDEGKYKEAKDKIDKLVSELNSKLKGKSSITVKTYDEQNISQPSQENEIDVNAKGFTYPEFNDDGTLKAQGNALSFISGTTTISGVDQGKLIDNDIDVNVGKSIGNGTKNHKYNLDIDWSSIHENAGTVVNSAFTFNSNNFSKEQWDNITNYLTENYTNTNSSGSFAIITKEQLKNIYPQADDLGDTVWFYYNGRWGYVQQNADGKKLREDLIAYANGSTPSRWK